MKPLLYLFSLGIFFTACERASDPHTKVSISLPAIATNAQILQEATPTTNSGDGGSDDKFLSLAPTDFGGSFPLNCFMVVVRGSDPALRNNYCGIANANGAVGKDFQFGEYLGFQSAGKSFEFELSSGKGRQFHVFGLYASDPDDCRALIEHPDKTKLSRPYLIGSSDLVDLVGGDATVNITLNKISGGQVVPYDDCVFEAAANVLPVANVLTVERPNFPFSHFRKPSAPGYYCEDVEVDVQFKDANGNLRAGTVANKLSAAIMGNVTNPASSTTVIPSYTNYNTCYNDTSGAAAADSFSIEPQQTKIRRWLRFTDTFGGAGAKPLYLAANSTDNIFSTELSAFRTYALETDASILIPQGYFPRRVLQNACVGIESLYRHMDGTAAGSIGTGFYPAANPASSTTTFYLPTDSSCASATVSLNGSSLYDTIDGFRYFMKTTDQAGFSIQAGPTSAPAVHYDYSSLIKAAGTGASSSSPISRLIVSGKEVVSSAAAQCSPIYLSLLNSDNNDAPAPAAGVIKLVGGSDTSDLKLFKNSDCVAPSELNSSGVGIAAGSYYTRLFVKPTSGNTNFGGRHLEFVYNDSVFGVFNLYLTGAAH